MKLFKKKKIMKQFESAKDLGEMGRVLAENDVISAPKDDHHNVFGECIDHLDEDGELPFGWTAHHSEFTGNLQGEFSHFLNDWVNSSNDVKKEYAALKSLIQYMEDVQTLCDSKGECFSVWCSEYLIGGGVLEKRKADLKYMEEHFDELLEKEKFDKAFKENVLPHLREDLLKIIEDNPGILQTDVYKMFGPEAKDSLSSELYFMAKDGLIHREKQGRSYALSL